MKLKLTVTFFVTHQIKSVHFLPAIWPHDMNLLVSIMEKSNVSEKYGLIKKNIELSLISTFLSTYLI